VQLANITTVHHSHTPVVGFQGRDNATGVWAMEDNHETYVRGESETRTHARRNVARMLAYFAAAWVLTYVAALPIVRRRLSVIYLAQLIDSQRDVSGRCLMTPCGGKEG
jgi:hypothetical protein